MTSDKPLSFRAYYYTFTPTGDVGIDLILSAIARAGKAYHHTDDWRNETSSPDERLKGTTPIEWIQNAASDAAARRSTPAAVGHRERARAWLKSWAPRVALGNDGSDGLYHEEDYERLASAFFGVAEAERERICRLLDPEAICKLILENEGNPTAAAYKIARALKDEG